MALCMVALLFLTSSHAVLGQFPAGPGMSFYPGGYPNNQPNSGPQSGFQSGQGHCVTSPQECSCPTVYFPLKNCYFCMCQTQHPTGQTTLASRSQSSTSDSTVPMVTTTAPPPMTSQVTSAFVTDYCLIASNLCQKNCPGGYLVDPNDCTFCMCKKDLIG